MNNEILFKPNSLIMAKSNCDNIKSNEYKVYDTVLQRCQYYQGYGFRKAELTRQEIKNIVKTNDYSTIKEISNTFEKFRNITMKFKLGTKYVTSSAIAEYVYDEGNDTFSISISENVFNILTQYSKYGYAPIDLKITRKAKSYYTQKMYGMFRAWSKHNQMVTHTYALTEIKQVCDIFDGKYSEYKIFKRDVIKKVLKELKKHFNMEVEILKEIRVNRKVAFIEFSIIDYETKKYDFDSQLVIKAKGIQKINDIAADIDEEISSIDYANLLDMNIKESVHKKFMNDFSDYKNYIKAVETASSRTLNAVGGKTINSRNYNYFKTSLNNLIVEENIL